MTDTPQAAITLSDKAVEKIGELLGSQPDGAEQALRVAVRGGGCSGFQVNNPNVVAACGCGSSFQVKDDAAEQAAAV